MRFVFYSLFLLSAISVGAQTQINFVSPLSDYWNLGDTFSYTSTLVGSIERVYGEGGGVPDPLSLQETVGVYVTHNGDDVSAPDDLYLQVFADALSGFMPCQGQSSSPVISVPPTIVENVGSHTVYRWEWNDILLHGGVQDQWASIGMEITAVHNGDSASNAFFVGVKSPDLNGDLVVDLTDVSLCTQYFGVQDYRVDFNHDLAFGISDYALFTPHLYTTCP